MARLEGYSGAIEELSAADFGPGRTWTPTAEHGVLRIRLEHGTVLIAAKGATVWVRGKRESQSMWIVVGASDGPYEIDGVGVEGNVQVRIETAVNVLEGVERTTRDTSVVPLIEIVARGVVRDFGGVVQLGRFNGQLISKRGSRSERSGQITEMGDRSQGGKLVGVDVTRLRAGPQLDNVRQLSVFSPDVESLYDLACPFDRMACRLRRWRRGALFDPSEDQDSTPRERAHWFRDLYAAMGSNAVPASTRAAVRWCYALLEHESIKPRRTPLRGVRARWLRHLVSREALESLGRWLHRCVGYGQRPSRALASWLVATAAVTVWSVQCRAVEGGAAGWLERIAEVLMSPLGVLRLGSGGEAGGLLGDPAFDPVAYLVVGLPFIFFVLSMREFFRSPLNPRLSMP